MKHIRIFKKLESRTQEWFDRSIGTAIETRNQNFQKFEKSKLASCEHIYKQSKYLVQK